MGTENQTSYPLTLTLRFYGESSSHNKIDLYDFSRSLMGVQRSLAITTHFILNREIITQATALKNSHIFTEATEPGSILQKINIGVTVAALTAILAAPADSVGGHVLYSIYDFIIKKTTGVHVDLEEPLYKTYLTEKSLKTGIRLEQLESVAEKCESAIKDIHRPLYASHTAKFIEVTPRGIEQRGLTFSSRTYDNMNIERVTPDTKTYIGRVASFSANTKKGKVYTKEEKRAISFEIDRDVSIKLTTLSRSLDIYTNLSSEQETSSGAGYFKFNAKRLYSANNTTKKYIITEIYDNTLAEVDQ